jgi:hypothetical protein
MKHFICPQHQFIPNPEQTWSCDILALSTTACIANYPHLASDWKDIEFILLPGHCGTTIIPDEIVSRYTAQQYPRRFASPGQEQRPLDKAVRRIGGSTSSRIRFSVRVSDFSSNRCCLKSPFIYKLLDVNGALALQNPKFKSKDRIFTERADVSGIESSYCTTASLLGRPTRERASFHP